MNPKINRFISGKREHVFAFANLLVLSFVVTQLVTQAVNDQLFPLSNNWIYQVIQMAPNHTILHIEDAVLGAGRDALLQQMCRMSLGSDNGYVCVSAPPVYNGCASGYKDLVRTEMESFPIYIAQWVMIGVDTLLLIAIACFAPKEKTRSWLAAIILSVLFTLVSIALVLPWPGLFWNTSYMNAAYPVVQFLCTVGLYVAAMLPITLKLCHGIKDEELDHLLTDNL